MHPLPLIWKHWSLLFWGDLWVGVLIPSSSFLKLNQWSLSGVWAQLNTLVLLLLSPGSEYVWFSATKTEMSSNNYSFQKPMKNVSALNCITVTLIYTDTLHHLKYTQTDFSWANSEICIYIFFSSIFHCIFVWTQNFITKQESLLTSEQLHGNYFEMLSNKYRHIQPFFVFDSM